MTFSDDCNIEQKSLNIWLIVLFTKLYKIYQKQNIALDYNVCEYLYLDTLSAIGDSLQCIQYG